MNKCLENDEIQDDILNQRIEAQKKYNIDSTPTILINEKNIMARLIMNSLKKEIQKRF